MASEVGFVSTASSTAVHAGSLSGSSALPTTPTSIASSPHISEAPDSERARLFRAAGSPRPDHPTTSHKLTTIANAGLRTSPAATSPKILRTLSPKLAPGIMTAAAAIADERRAAKDAKDWEGATRKSPNPANNALGALLGRNTGMSRLQDAPTSTSGVSEGLAVVANSISRSDPMQLDSNAQTSPVSMSSVTSLNGTTLPTSVGGKETSSPHASTASIDQGKDLDDLQRTPTNHQTPEDAMNDDERPSNRALTFPGPALAHLSRDDPRTPLRGMSLPMAGSGHGSSRSSSSKKHKCPYCSTDFTRHHNLKSHLLTHSHEKPFVCSTCQARFRRLHDLKRHTKLHTGERPHTCHRCGRSFARGDALARHNKGQGGCAGRRASQGSFAGEDESLQAGEDGMDGLLYTGSSSQDPDRMDDDGELSDERRRLSLPSIQAQGGPTSGVTQISPTTTSPGASQPFRGPSTYPPGARREATAANPGLLHPPPSQGGSIPPVSSSGQTPIATPNPAGSSTSTIPLGAGGSSILSQGGMTESPKPLSPAGISSQHGHPETSGIHRHRSPSLTQQFQQHHFGRKSNGRTPPPIGLPPMQGKSNAPHLPSLPGLNVQDARYTLSSQMTGIQQGGGQSAQHGQPPGGNPSLPSSALSHTSAISGGASAAGSTSSREHGSGDGPGSLLASGTERLWTYVRALEDRINQLTEEVTTLKGESGQHRRETTGPGTS